jgi:hypothetical protein
MIMMHLFTVVNKLFLKLNYFFKWHIHFDYYKKKSFCYLNPIKKENAIDLCFKKGHNLKNHKAKIIDKDKKLVVSLCYADLKSIGNKVLNEVLLEVKDLYL